MQILYLSLYHFSLSPLSQSIYCTHLIGEPDLQYLCQKALKTYQERSVVKPRNPLEAQIESVWRQQLGAKSTLRYKHFIGYKIYYTIYLKKYLILTNGIRLR